MGKPKRIGIEKEASYIISIINPKAARPPTSQVGLPITEAPPKYLEEVLNEFSETENFLTKDTKFIDYQNAQIILIGSREGRDVIKNEIGIEI